MARDLLTENQVAAGLATVKWTVENGELTKTVTLDDFRGALDFVNRVGAEAERLDHHPDMWISWNIVRLRVSTHSEGGLTQMDFDLAQAVDRLTT